MKFSLSPCAAARNADAFIGLDAGALPFGDLHVDDDGIAGLERRHLGAGQLGCVLGLDLLDDVHWYISCRDAWAEPQAKRFGALF